VRFVIAFLILLSLVCFQVSAQPGERVPVPPVAPPAGSLPAVRDTCANFWTLAPAEKGARRLLVLPAQAPTAWLDPQISGVAPGAWRTIRADELGFVWLTRDGRTMLPVRFDPRKPKDAARDTVFTPTSFAAQTHWRVVTRMPASNHDLTAAVLHDKVYVAGGLTAEWGFPTRSHAFDELWELDPKSWGWRVAARFGRARIYCATAALDNKVWIIGGDVLEADGTRHAVTTVQLYDPRTETVTEGVPNTLSRPMPLALAAGGRLYVLGNPRDQYDQPGQMESLGPGETTWRPEPDAPSGPGAMGPLAGTTLDGKLYVALRGRGLAVFDAKTRIWEMIESPAKPRSCQMAAYRGEIWLMGGRDTGGEEQTLIFTPHTRHWRKGPALPRPLSWGAAAVGNGQLIVTGGAGSYGKDYLYNDRTFIWRGRSSLAR
jgi:hypothetical protein